VAYFCLCQLSMKKPLLSPNMSGSISSTSGIFMGRISISADLLLVVHRHQLLADRAGQGRVKVDARTASEIDAFQQRALSAVFIDGL